MSIKPLDDRIVVRRSEAQTLSAGGIIIPDKAAEKPSEGIVIAAGPGKLLENGKRLPVSVKVNDRVLFTKYGAKEVSHEGEKLLILRESDLLAVVETEVEEERAA